MTREEAIEFMRGNARDFYLTKAPKDGYICPVCRSGSGKHGTGITTNNGIHFTCWARECFKGADVFDMIGVEYKLDNFNDQFNKACEIYGITVDSNTERMSFTAPKPKPKQTQLKTKTTAQNEPKADYTDFIREASIHIGETDYHRGISLDTLKRFHIGYIKSYNRSEIKSAKGWECLVIPYGPHSYALRNLDTNGERYRKIGKQDVLFNQQALWNTAKPVFVVEGEFDAMSIVDVGGEAVSIGGTSGIGLLVKLIEEHKPKQPLVLALDNDSNSVGQDKQQELADKLQSLNIHFYSAKGIYGGFKDANEFLCVDRERFTQSIHNTENKAKGVFKDMSENTRIYKKEGETQEHFEERARTLQKLDEKNLRANKVKDLVEWCTNIDKYIIPTGFKSIDRVWEGGIHCGDLHTIIANSSVGKSTLCLQIADYVARSGRDVLYYSLETSNIYLNLKTLSRMSLEFDFNQNKSLEKAISTGEIPKKLVGPNADEYYAKLLKKFEEDYSRNFSLIDRPRTIEQICEEVELYVGALDEVPVVFIDYLQFLSRDDNTSNKDIVDKAVRTFKSELCLKHKVPLVLISSVNRQSYYDPIDTGSAKESGEIEFTSDYYVGLQYSGMDELVGETDAKKKSWIAEFKKKIKRVKKDGSSYTIHVKNLKQRMGADEDVELDFYPKFSCFREADKPEIENSKWGSLLDNNRARGQRNKYGN